PICVGLPGSLPLLNKKAIEYATMICVALNCNIPEKISFYRKNYFYPDLPKNYQVTQYNSYELSSIGYDGMFDYGESIGIDDGNSDNDDDGIANNRNSRFIEGAKKNNKNYNNTQDDTQKNIEVQGDEIEDTISRKARIKRIQLEEDPGKITYEEGNSKINNYCLIDYNRAGVALIEIVTEPDFKNPEDVRLFLNKITNIFEYLGISDPSLEGAVRCDANVSIRGGKKVEIKNISSFKDVEKSLFYEITRQKTMSMHEIEVKSETRHWDERRKITIPARTKEEEEEYRYFPDPDIPRINLGKEFGVKIKEKMPELPLERLNRYMRIHKLSAHVSNILVNNKKIGDFYEESIHLYNSPKEVSSWIVNELLSKSNENPNEGEQNHGQTPFNIAVRPSQIADIAKLVEQNSVNRNIAKDIFNKSIKTGKSPLELIQSMKIEKIDDVDTIKKYIKEILEQEKHLIEQSKTNPKTNNFILGKIMKKTQGRVDPQITLKLISEATSGINVS
ncbi:MAG: Asp-tRNA(Asn)/Glu-tRNA(Gln) amidotransferase subunit GatB, partial [Thermoproteota archaeon]|nr:Asp-tRNA(Asn)/Glu-tRNA(Gln) amidotransferase subunit GatB [Thermoproteota archaeon]